MYQIPRGNDEYSNLVSPREAYSVPNQGFYQNDSDELFVNYGTVTSSQPVKVHSTKYDT